MEAKMLDKHINGHGQGKGNGESGGGWPESDRPGEAYFRQQQGRSPVPKLTFFEDITTARRPWVVHNLLGEGDISNWIGAPKEGKSAVVLDLGVSTARGKDWRGRRIKK